LISDPPVTFSLGAYISDLGGYFDVVAFHKEDLEIAINIRAAEYANRLLKEERNNGNAR
jgi:hypothetical protein